MSLRGLYEYAGSLTRPVTLYGGNQGHHRGGSMNGTHPCGRMQTGFGAVRYRAG